jgi:hypothetical protein
MRCRLWLVDGCRENGAKRVIRGGSWNDNARNCRSANRNANDPGNRNNNLGFRCARAQAEAGWPLSEQTFVPVIPNEMTKPSGGGCVSSRYGENSPACLLNWRNRCALARGGLKQ